MSRKVTERDFRMPEFQDANPDDYEFRGDGKIVRKDRWERGIHRIVGILDMNNRDFEIDYVVARVRSISETPTLINRRLIEGLEWALDVIRATGIKSNAWERQSWRDEHEAAIEALDNAKRYRDDE